MHIGNIINILKNIIRGKMEGVSQTAKAFTGQGMRICVVSREEENDGGRQADFFHIISFYILALCTRIIPDRLLNPLRAFPFY